MMENLKIKVSTPQESKEAQELFFELGYEWVYTGKYIQNNICFIYSNGEKKVLTQGSTYKGFSEHKNKEITLPQLKDMVVLKRNKNTDATHIDSNNYDWYVASDEKHYRHQGDVWVYQPYVDCLDLKPIEKPMKEYLEKQIDGTYKLVMRGDACEADDIEVPDGADLYVYFEEYENCNFYKGDYKAVWQDGGYWDHAMDDYKNYCKEFGIVLWQREPELPFNTDLEDVLSIEDENNHYFIDVSDLDRIDFYEIARRYKVADPCIQHILKKCLAVGDRGYKDFKTDIKDIYKTARRATIIHGVSIDK